MARPLRKAQALRKICLCGLALHPVTIIKCGRRIHFAQFQLPKIEKA
jgi:hypothetical protein